MPEQPDPQPPLPPEENHSAGQFEAQGDIQAGRDIAGRDIIQGDVIGGDRAGRDIVNSQTTNIGFSQQAVLKLVVIVGVIVFLTAACFFSGGVVVGLGALAVLNRPVTPTQESARSMQVKLNALQSSQPSQPFNLTFTEQEISSYFRFIAGPEMGIMDGEVRLLEPGKLIVAGRTKALGNLPFAATFQVVKDQPGATLQLTAAAVKLLPLPFGGFGWVAVPVSLLQPFAEQINQNLGTNFFVTNVTNANQPTGVMPTWMLDGMTTSPR